MKKFKTLKWVCRTCGWTWEVLSVIVNDNPPVEKCLSCESYDTSTVIQAPSIQFKGSGFHSTDYS